MAVHLMLDYVHYYYFVREAFQKKNRGFSEFGTKGGRVSDLNHYFEQQ